MALFKKKPVVIEAITFEQLVEFGKANGGNIVNEMPWSFDYKGHKVTHENENCYLIPTAEGTMQFHRGELLITGVKGEIYPCKPDIFDSTYEPVPATENSTAEGIARHVNLDFGAALRLLKAGVKVCRRGWNGKGMYLWLLPAQAVKKEWVKDPMLLELFGDHDMLQCLGSIRMKTALGECLTGWLASQTDMLAEDWEEVV